MSVLKELSCEGFRLSHSFDKAPRERDFEPHIHDDYELFCLVKGSVDYMVEGKLYRLHSGAVMLMRSSETHNLIVNKSTEYERYVLNFKPSFVLENGFSREILAPYRERGLGERNMYLPEELEGVSPISYLERAFAQGEYLDARTVALSTLSTLLCEINVAFKSKSEPQGSQNQAEQELIAYVNENLTTELTIDDIARHFHMSASQVSRIFKRATLTSVHNYIITKRLILFNKKIAKGVGVIEACHECGFRDYSAFYRLYKKRYGKSPAKK
ncbi:MAG: helix-turn-helix transcriptional regulator [Clostridia bacterium]|nr:helix-turn-helix transcriptional regulator [Clostridia bacterium]